MAGKAYIADTVKKDMTRLSELLDEISSGVRNGYNTVEEFEEARDIIESYIQTV